MEKTRKKSMVPEFLRTRKTYMLTAIIVTIIGILSLSYAFFSRQSLMGETSNNTINVQTVEGTSQSFVTTYENGSNEIMTGILNLSSTPYIKMSKFSVRNIYNASLNVTINWAYVTSTLIQTDSSYNLYECTVANYANATINNASSICTLVSPTTGNYLPNSGETKRLQSATDIPMSANQTRYYVVIINIGVSNNGRSFQGIIKVKDRFARTLTINYDNGSASTSMDLAAGDSVTLPTTTKTGYTFNKWILTENLDSTLSGSTFVMGSESTTVKALWTANTYTVTYNCNGGSNYVSSTTHTYGTPSNLSSNPCYKFTTGTSGMVYAVSKMTYNGNNYTVGQSVSTLTSTNNGNVTMVATWDNLFSYSGSYNVIDDSNGNWRVKFTTSGTYIQKYAKTIDTFLVGGGGGGSNSFGKGGGGGYTKTVYNYNPSLNVNNAAIVGAGGGIGSRGETTSIFDYLAYGGTGGEAHGGTLAGCGGSGGGILSGTGGTDGGNATGGSSGILGIGQGITTREFGEPTGTLYAGGGAGESGSRGDTTGGTACSNAAAPANFGGGGGGCGGSGGAGSGGSGIIVIRNSRQSSPPNYYFNWNYTDIYRITAEGTGWKAKLYRSGYLQFKTDTYIDIFLVGGGGGGSSSFGKGGGGGYTETKRNYKATIGEYYVSIGAGGAGGGAGSAGGATTAFGYTVNGGGGAQQHGGTAAGSGGSGGAILYGTGGTDGGNGIGGSSGIVGSGQGSTTREFGEGTGELYAGGGAGESGSRGDSTAGSAGASAQPFYGGGGGGCGGTTTAGSGGSGTVVIRNKR